jgi:hypothetical protein
VLGHHLHSPPALPGRWGTPWCCRSARKTVTIQVHVKVQREFT